MYRRRCRYRKWKHTLTRKHLPRPNNLFCMSIQCHFNWNKAAILPQTVWLKWAALKRQDQGHIQLTCLDFLQSACLSVTYLDVCDCVKLVPWVIYLSGILVVDFSCLCLIWLPYLLTILLVHLAYKTIYLKGSYYALIGSLDFVFGVN